MAKVEKSASKAVGQKQKQDEKKLVSLDKKEESKEEASVGALPGELNSRLGALDAGLDAIRTDIERTNQGVKDSIGQLSDKDADLTSRVSETYQRLGTLDASYKALSGASAEINAEVKEISAGLKKLAEQSQNDIGLLNEGHEALIAQTGELSKKAKETMQMLKQSIKANNKAMSELEQKLKADIDSLAETTRQRDDDIAGATDAVANELGQTNQEVQRQQAKILKMQSVDQALEKRSSALEETTGELNKTTRALTRSSGVLTRRADEFAAAIEALRMRADRHEQMISELQEDVEENRQSLFSFMREEKQHVIGLLGAIGIVILVVLAFFVWQHFNWGMEAERNTAMQNHVETVQSGLSLTDRNIDVLDGRVAQMDAEVKQELHDIQNKLVTMVDQVDSLDGRVSNIRPFSDFGGDNTIKGEHWLEQQPVGHFSIAVTQVSDKRELYRLAEQYSHFLKDDLAYLTTGTQQKPEYVLFLGSYATQDEATMVLSSLPRYVGRQNPMVIGFEELRK